MKDRKKTTKKVGKKIWGISKADKVFSDFIRKRDGWICRNCKKDCSERKGELHNSHFWGRGRMNTRFDEKNCIALCYQCHYWKFEKEKQGRYRDMMILILGLGEYKSLEKRAYTFIKKRDAIKRFMEKWKSL